MKKLLIVFALILSANVSYPQLILNSLKQQAYDAADKQILRLVDKLKKNKKDTVKQVAAAVPAENSGTWDCEKCSKKGNTGKFCTECGSKKPEPITPWTCPKCGKEQNTSNFCSECGAQRPEEWKCPECGKNNTGNFCDDCGTKNPNIIVNIQSPKVDYTAFVDNLKPASAENWNLVLSICDDSNPSSTLSLKNYQEALNATLELPTAKSMVIADSISKWKEQQKNLEAALSIMTQQYSNYVNELSEKASSSEATQSGEGTEAKLLIDSTDISEAIKAQSLTLEGLSEDIAKEKISSALIPYLSKKWDIPEATMTKIIKMALADEEVAAEYLAQKYPDKASLCTNIRSNDNSKKEKYSEIKQKLNSLNDEYLKSNGTALEDELKVLAEKISSSWTESEECKNVVTLETALDDMSFKWEKVKDGNNETPTFWISGRKAENEVIASWNAKYATEWRDIIQKHLSSDKVFVESLVSLETELEQIRGNAAPDADYIETKKLCSSMIPIVVKYSMMPAAVLSIPLASYVPEKK